MASSAHPSRCRAALQARPRLAFRDPSWGSAGLARRAAGLPRSRQRCRATSMSAPHHSSIARQRRWARTGWKLVHQPAHGKLMHAEVAAGATLPEGAAARMRRAAAVRLPGYSRARRIQTALAWTPRRWRPPGGREANLSSNRGQEGRLTLPASARRCGVSPLPPSASPSSVRRALPPSGWGSP